MNALVPVRNEPKMMLLEYMADKYSLRPEQFSKTVRATCGLSTATPEQFAAFLIVAKEYGLNPLTKEICAFPSRGGGIVPIVPIDGWVNLVNSHKQCDGFEFEMEHDDDGKLVSCTCRIHRKDRKHPVTVTEYLSECIRQTEPWKMQHRMLRHKSFIQAARYAFGFAGVYDEDEARNIVNNEQQSPRDVTPPRVPSPAEVEQIEDHGSDKYAPGDVVDLAAAASDPISSGPSPAPQTPSKKGTLPDVDKDYDGFVSLAIDRISKITDGGELESFLATEITPFEAALFPPDLADIVACYDKQQQKLNADE